jgi:hypothetical protein
MDIRLHEILEEYASDWSEALIPTLKITFPNQLKQFIQNYFERLTPLEIMLCKPGIKLGSDEDKLFKEYKSIGFYITWISLLRTLDIRVTYMLLQRTSIIFTQYLIVFCQTKQHKSAITFSVGELVSYILKNLLGNIEVPIHTDIDDAKRQLLWSELVKLYSNCKLGE